VRVTAKAEAQRRRDNEKHKAEKSAWTFKRQFRLLVCIFFASPRLRALAVKGLTRHSFANISTSHCGKLCGQRSRLQINLLPSLHFQRNAHASGVLITSSQTIVCFYSKDRVQTLRLYFAVALLCCVAGLCGCARLERQSASSSESQASIVENPPNLARIEINSASASQLERLPGVGSGLAERIVAYRKQRGPFRRLEHLMMVRGISERKFRALQPYIEVR
jgi:competence ComEA-like helix-hairpin-helix protein